MDKLLPNIPETAILSVSGSHFIAATTFTTNSGIDVPKATTVSHITN